MRSTRPGVSPDAEEEAGVLERVAICGTITISVPRQADKFLLVWPEDMPNMLSSTIKEGDWLSISKYMALPFGLNQMNRWESVVVAT
jgi:hypothetical protein